ncbi:hypothetical protein MesoLj131c_22240 [Mesorhizobium sp. 131-3-5]|nr:hypothetical protein MesoLj131c_22240 [Mesorhizobium sp. 131-3-5]
MKEYQDIAEHSLQQGLELHTRKLVHVIGISRASGRRIDISFRGRKDEKTSWPQNPLNLCNEQIMLKKMLKRFERYDHVDTRVFQRQLASVSLLIAKVGSDIAPLGVRYRLLRQLDANDRSRDLGQESGAVALA